MNSNKVDLLEINNVIDVVFNYIQTIVDLNKKIHEDSSNCLSFICDSNRARCRRYNVIGSCNVEIEFYMTYKLSSEINDSSKYAVEVLSYIEQYLTSAIINNQLPKLSNNNKMIKIEVIKSCYLNSKDNLYQSSFKIMYKHNKVI